jgi:hypothetical protein
MGIDSDLRGRKAIEDLLKRNREKYERLSKKEREDFDKESLTNPYLDSGF